MSDGLPVILRSKPGIKRDGTVFEGDSYVDGQWLRFQRGLPRKIAGFKSITSNLLEKTYGMSSYAQSNVVYNHLGSATRLEQVRVNFDGTFAGQTDRVPVAGFVPDANNLWQFDLIGTAAAGNKTSVIAHPAPNLMDIANSTETKIFYGDANATTALVATGMDSQSGGIVVLSPFLVSYGNAGRVDVSAAGDLVTPPNSAFVTGQKIVKGLPLRNDGGPAALLWSLDSLIQMAFDPSLLSGVPFRFNTIDGEISVLSSQSIILHQGIYYWPGVDCWYMFNGVVREIANPYNLNWFFDNLNFAQRQKVFAYKVPRFGEIWWCYPRGNATECTHAVIYNVREGYWYDTELPGSGRSAGIYAKVYNKPFMVDVDLTGTGYTMFQHETGVDSVIGSDTNAIPSWFETSDFTLLIGDQPQNKNLRVSFVESDFVQSGDLTITVKGQANARAAVEELRTVTVPEIASTTAEQIAPFKDEIRLMRFKVESNEAGGDYQMGQCLAHLEPASGRMTK